MMKTTISRGLHQLQRLSLTLLVCTVAVMHTEAGATQSYSITNLGSLSTQYPRSYAYSLNASGDVVGYAYPSTGQFQGFLWKDGVMTNLGHLADPYNYGTPHSLALGVNGVGQVVGWSELKYSVNSVAYERAVLWQNGGLTDLGTFPNYLASVANALNNVGQIVGVVSRSIGGVGGDRAFLWQDGAMTDLGSLGGTASAAYAINDAGQVVGKSYTSNNAATHAFLWQHGVMTDLGTLGAGTVSVASAINASGQVVGAATFAGPGDLQDRHAFLYSNGTMTDLGVPTSGVLESVATGINSAGIIVGGAGGHGYVYSDGMWTDLNTVVPANSGWTLGTAQAINDAGQIVGAGNFNGTTFGYLLTPVTGSPPPPTVPAAPMSLTAIKGNKQVSLTWNASSGAASYNVKRSTTSGGPYSTIVSGLTATGYTNTGLTNGRTYYFVVSAVNNVGESQNSVAASATPARK